MSSGSAIVVGAVAIAGGLIALIKPVLNAFSRDKSARLTISVEGRDNQMVSVTLTGESGQEAIRKIMAALEEHGDNATTQADPK